MFGNPSYPSYQIFLAAAIAAIVVIVVMPLFIKLMRHEGVGQQIRADGPQRHLVKQGTPTMGGVVFLLAVLVTCVIQAKWTTDLVLAMAATFATGSLGLLDDIESVAHKRSLGLTPLQKMVGLVLISVTFCLVAVNTCRVAPWIELPGGFAINLGVLTTVIDLGGTISGEHGIGLEKKQYMPLQLGDEQMRIMRGICRIFDPYGIMNPGKLEK